MTRPDDLVRILRSGDAARPRLIWHAPDERIELSGRVLATWVSKAADMLQEELDAEVGTRVRLVGTPHWRLLVWALGTWTVGGVVDVSFSPAPADITVVDAEAVVAGAVETGTSVVVALTRAALARRSTVDLPPGVIDEAAVLLTYADDMDPVDRADGDDPALVTGDATSTYAEVVPAGTPDRRHVSGRLGLAHVLTTASATWAAGGSIVLTDPAWEERAGADPTSGVFADTLASEGATV